MSGLDNLTFGELKELAMMFRATGTAVTGDETFTPHIGKVCIVRTYASGVFMAKIVKQSGRMIEMQNCRRLWAWKASDGISLSSVAVNGVNSKASKFPEVTTEHTVLDALEIIPASEKCIASVNATPLATQS